MLIERFSVKKNKNKIHKIIDYFVYQMYDEEKRKGVSNRPVRFSYCLIECVMMSEIIGD